MTRNRPNFSWLRFKWSWVICISIVFCIFAATGYADSHSEDVTAQNTSGFPSLITNFANWTAQGFLIGFSAIIFVLWLCLSWAVLKLYMALGTYILPIWDVSSGPGTTVFGHAVPAFQCVDANTAYIIGQIAFVFFCLSTVLVFVVTSADAVKVSLTGEDGQRIFVGFSYAFTAMLLFPWIYTGIITLANDLAQLVQNITTASFANNGQSISNSLFSVSIFGTMDNNTQQAIRVGAFSGAVAAIPGNTVIDPNVAFANVFAANGNMWQSVQSYVTASPEMYVSRLIQIVLCIMALLEMILVLLLKGAQIVGIVINFFLGIIACSLLASPKTRPMFFQWFKGFLELCLWGFVWALLLMATWIMLAAVNSFRGFDNATVIGIFLLPFLLFGTIKKFTEVAGIIGGIAVTGALVTGVGRALQSGFNQNSGPAASVVGGALIEGGAFSSHVIGRIADGASRLALVVPGVGSGMASAIQGASKIVGPGTTGVLMVGRAFSDGVLQPKGQNIADVLKAAGRFGNNIVSSNGAGHSGSVEGVNGSKDIGGKFTDRKKAFFENERNDGKFKNQTLV